MEEHAYHQVPSVGVKRMPEVDLNGTSKRMSYGSSEHGEVVFRILCPGTKTGSIIGKGGSIIKQIRDETGARIKVAEAVPGVEERAVIVSGPETPGTDFCPAQQALFRVHQRIIEPDGGEQLLTGTITTRLLVPSSQIGCILGKQGSIIAEMRAATGAQIRILPKDQLPGCALPSDETLQLVGEVSSVKAALSDASSRLRANPPRDRTAGQAIKGQPIGLGGGGALHSSFGGHPIGSTPLSSSSPYGSQPPNSWGYGAAVPPGGPVSYGGYGISARTPPPPPPVGPAVGGEVVMRLLCPASKVGSIIGKGGSIIKQLRDLTGARIRVEDAVGDCEERVITITGVEEPGAVFSPAQEGLFHVHARVMDVTAAAGDHQQPGAIAASGGPPGSSAKETGPAARLLVPTAQVGCILGKRGSIIAEIRRTSGAVVRILSRDQLPQCAAETDELLQVVGTREKIQEALRQIAMRLRANPPRDPRGTATQQPPQHAAGAPLSGMGGTPSTYNYADQSSFQQQPQGGEGALSTVLNISIPSSAVGTLIGKGGENIKKVRVLSGAKVRLLETEGGGLQALERTVEIIGGSEEQIKMAHDLVQAFIAQAQAGGATGPPPSAMLGGVAAAAAPGMGSSSTFAAAASSGVPIPIPFSSLPLQQQQQY